MLNLPPAAKILSERSISYRLFQHQNQITSIEEAALERNQNPDQIIRSILFRADRNIFILVLVAGPGQISWPKLRKYLGLSRISMASHEEVFATTGYMIGSVTPIGLKQPIRILADESVFTSVEVSIGSGVRNTAIILNSMDLRNLITNLEIGQFSEDNNTQSNILGA